MDIFDDFSGADNTTLTGRIRSDGGAAPIVWNGRWVITNNAARLDDMPTAGVYPGTFFHGNIVWDVGSKDITFNHVWNGDANGFILRGADLNNLYRLLIRAGSYELYRVIGGAATGLSNSSIPTPIVNGDLITISILNNVITVKRNGTNLFAPYTDVHADAILTGNKHGYSNDSTTAQYSALDIVDDSVVLVPDEYAIQGVDFTLPGTLSNGVTRDTDGKWSPPAGTTSWTFSVQILTDSNTTEINEKLNLNVDGVIGYGVIIEGEAELVPLTEIVVNEAPYGLLNSSQQTAIASGGAYPMITAAKNSSAAASFAVYRATTENGAYTLIADNQPYSNSANVVGALNFDHRSISVDTTSAFPLTIAANTHGLLVDDAGQLEHLRLNNVVSETLEGETQRILRNIKQSIYDSLPIKVGMDNFARLYVVPTPVILNSLETLDSTIWIKVAPKTAGGTQLALSSIAAIPLTIKGIARKPDPIRLPSYGPSSMLTFQTTPIDYDTDLKIQLSKSSRLDSVPSGFFTPSGALEAGTTLHVDVMPVDGVEGSGIIRTLDADANGLVTYTRANRAVDIGRTLTKYIAYAKRGSIRSAGWPWVIEQVPSYVNSVKTVAISQSGSTLTAVVTLKASEGAPQGSGQETFLAFMKLSGTLFDNINMDNLAVPAGVQIFAINKESGEFFVQGARNLTTYNLTIPFTGGTGESLVVSAGRREDGVSEDVVVSNSIAVT